MKRLIKQLARLMLLLMLGTITLSSCELQPDDEILSDLESEFNDETSGDQGERKK